jgi:hypothetical protein
VPRVLIVTSMAAPFLAADAHRARVLAGALPAWGWEAELLVPDDSLQLPEHRDPHADLLAADVPIHRAPARWQTLFRLMQARSLGWKALPSLKRAGDRLLSAGGFDLVYFSSAQHPHFYLGVPWRRRFGMPFVVDLHDPWFVEAPREPSHLPRLKTRAANGLARFLERATVASASGVVSVSPSYLDTLARRYRGRGWPALRPDRQRVIPFGVDERDFDAAGRLADGGLPLVPGRRTIVYTGAGSTIMERSFRELCLHLARIRSRTPDRCANLSIELFGTEPLARSGGVLARVARETGVDDIVREETARLGYLDALGKVTRADGLLVLGVDDPAYMPSKLFLYAMTGRPLLACVHEHSVITSYFDREPGLGRLIHFGEAAPAATAQSLVEAFLDDVIAQRTTDRRAMLREWLAPSGARQHAGLFDAIIADDRRPG